MYLMSIIWSWSISSTIINQCSHCIKANQSIRKAVSKSDQLTAFNLKAILKSFLTVVVRMKVSLSKRVKTFHIFDIFLPAFFSLYFALVFVAFPEILPLPSCLKIYLDIMKILVKIVLTLGNDFCLLARKTRWNPR